jgi:hypothetical protein
MVKRLLAIVTRMLHMRRTSTHLREADLPPFFFSVDHKGRMVSTTDRGKTWKPLVRGL